MKHIFAIAVALGALWPLAARAQVGVGTATPDAKSALDIRATDKGLLIPRLTAAQRAAITSPPQGLMVYQTDGSASGGAQTGFWYYVGTGGWVYLDAASGTLTLPYSGTANTSSPVLSITNTGTGGGLVGTATSGAGITAASTSGPALAASKNVGQTGRLISLVSPLNTNDSTAAYIYSGGERPTLRAVNTALSPQAAIRGVKQVAAADGAGVEGLVTSGASGNAAGVRGLDNSGSGGTAGVLGRTAGGYGVLGLATASGGYGVTGTATDAYGVSGGSTSGDGVHGASTSGAGVSGTSSSDAGVKGTSTSAAGVQGTSSANSTATGGVVGTNNAGGSAVGVLGTTTTGYGVRGTASASGGYGVSGVATDSYGVRGVSTSGAGVQGTSTSGSGVVGTTGAGNSGGLAGVVGTNSNSSGIGVLGQTASGYGVRGEATGTSGYGVTGVASNTNGIGVLGSATGGASGVTGQATGTGRAGYFVQNNSSYTGNAVDVAHSGSGYGLHVSSPNQTAYFENTSITGTGNAVVVQSRNNGYAMNVRDGGVLLTSPGNGSQIEGVLFPSQLYLGYTNATQSQPGTFITYDGARFRADNASQIGPGQLGKTAIFAEQTQSTATNFAGIFFGNLFVSGTLSVSGAKAFQIDHPLDPENKFLFHSCVESPDMMNIYNGNAKLDAQGRATVELPSYFEALNQDFRYQLTSVGAPGPNLYVAERVHGNQFRIAGGTPGAEVSWQVTGIRHDANANQHRLVPEVAKSPEQRGHYLTPEAFGLPASRGMSAASGNTSLAGLATPGMHCEKTGPRVGF
ncbi:hypothetical protein MUN81_08015 [Hymenobacter sp. 5317J-9]|uniref:beta strand repeat-containing protein n=1 Tax=Hymenobacter sp. 5317J-9 TaxID=2932250 RepID=UPI001FD6E888|nr:hypothetical protein [Hymenobacter sp. 5317J-9]UOQ99430.1 hypothetical protein MUN81_08015 [Hymenobacter sp. 5317J-9]